MNQAGITRTRAQGPKSPRQPRFVVRPEHCHLDGAHLRLWCLYDIDNLAFVGATGKERQLQPNLVLHAPEGRSITTTLSNLGIQDPQDVHMAPPTIIDPKIGRLYLSVAQTAPSM